MMKNKREENTEELKMLKIFLEGLRQGIKKNYYKPIRTKSTFNSDYVEYESKGDKDKNLTPEDYLDIIRPFLGDNK